MRSQHVSSNSTCRSTAFFESPSKLTRVPTTETSSADAPGLVWSGLIFGVFETHEWIRRLTTRARPVKDTAKMARMEPSSIEGSAPDVAPVEGHGLEGGPVPLPQVEDVAGVPDNVTVTVAVLGTVSVAVVATWEEIVSVTVVG